MNTSVDTRTDTVAAVRPVVVYGALMAGTLMSALSQTVVGTALPTIVGELGGIESLSWVVTASMLTSTVSIPLFGKVSDLYGRKLLYQGAIVLYLVGSLLSASATSIAQLALYRGLQGIGSGGLLALSQTILGDLIPPRERGRYMGYMGAVFAASTVGGPVLGGFLVDHFGWRWCFLVSVPIGLVALGVTQRYLQRSPGNAGAAAVDVPGAMLLTAAAAAAMLVATWGGIRYPWTSPLVLSLGTGAAVATLVLVVREARAGDPVLPLRLFRSSIFTVSCVVGFVVGLAMLGSITFLPLFLQVVTGVTATNSGLLILPAMSGFLVSSLTAGRVMSRTARYKALPVVGIPVMGVGLVLLSSMNASTGRLTVSAYMTVLGLGAGLVMQVLILAVQNAVSPGDLGIATSTATFFRSMGGAFGVAIFGSILSASLQRNLATLLPGLAGSGGSRLGLAALDAAPARIQALPGPIHDLVVEAFARSMQSVFRWSVPGAVIAFAVVLFLREKPLRESAGIAPAART